VGHSHGLVDDSIRRSRAGLRVVASALLILALILRITRQCWCTLRHHESPGHAP